MIKKDDLKELFAKGKRGLIYKTEFNGKEAIVKVNNPESTAISRIQNEGYFLELLNKHNIGPELYYFNDEMVVMEFVDGILIEEFVSSADISDIKKVLKEVLRQCFTLDSLNINKAEMHHPVKHIIVRENKPILIDFERCRKSLKVKNVTQFCQFINSTKFSSLLKKKGILIDMERLRKLSQEYSKQPTKKNLEEIIKLI